MTVKVLTCDPVDIASVRRFETALNDLLHSKETNKSVSFMQTSASVTTPGLPQTILTAVVTWKDQPLVESRLVPGITLPLPGVQ